MSKSLQLIYGDKIWWLFFIILAVYSHGTRSFHLKTSLREVRYDKEVSQTQLMSWQRKSRGESEAGRAWSDARWTKSHVKWKLTRWRTALRWIARLQETRNKTSGAFNESTFHDDIGSTWTNKIWTQSINESLIWHCNVRLSC